MKRPTRLLSPTNTALVCLVLGALAHSPAIAEAPKPAPSTLPAPSSSSPAEAAPAPTEAADNQVTPLNDAALQARARALFDGIVSGDASLAEVFWFPRAPFERLKDIPEPGKYWEQLHRTYQRDVRVLHQRRRSWDGATFVRFELSRPAKWVAPGKEGNSIGYYRSLHGQLTYSLDGKERSLDVHTVITWQGSWYVTHLNPFR